MTHRTHHRRKGFDGFGAVELLVPIIGHKAGGPYGIGFEVDGQTNTHDEAREMGTKRNPRLKPLGGRSRGLYELNGLCRPKLGRPFTD